MRQEPNNGIDLLLRQMGRREESLPAEFDGQHLDADELSSYVANALPPAARARYTRHIADCSSCRKIVAQLSASEAVAAVKQPVGVIEPSGFKSFLASLFSPLVLRYAVPALGLIIVAVIGVVVMRDKPGTSVARLENTDQNKSVLADQTAVTAATPTPAQAAASNKPAPVPAATAVPPQQPLVASEPPPPAPKATPAEAAEKQPEPEKQKLETKAAEINAADARRDYDSAKREQRQADEAGAATSAPATAPGSKVAEPQRARAAEVMGPQEGGARTRQESNSAPKDDAVASFLMSGETKTVSGRTFQKRGEIWIDTAYASPRSTTNIARGSEQYRALVADEPAIQTIADTLKSEFIVVWKGRPYRIR